MRCTECGQEVENEPLRQLLAHCRTHARLAKKREEESTKRQKDEPDNRWIQDWIKNAQKCGQRWQSWAEALEAAIELRNRGDDA